MKGGIEMEKTLKLNKRYFVKPGWRTAYYKGIRESYWAGEMIREYVFEDICGAELRYNTKTFNPERDIDWTK